MSDLITPVVKRPAAVVDLAGRQVAGGSTPPDAEVEPRGDPRVMEQRSRFVAVDWSGAKTGAQKKIWLAEVIDGALVRLESGRDRAALTEHLLTLVQEDPGSRIYIGLDFAFSLPQWFLTSERSPSRFAFFTSSRGTKTINCTRHERWSKSST